MKLIGKIQSLVLVFIKNETQRPVTTIRFDPEITLYLPAKKNTQYIYNACKYDIVKK